MGFLPCTVLQADEIWSFAGCKEKRVPIHEKGQGRGDVWTWTALCADTKLIAAYRVGNRDADTARAFMLDLSERVNHRIQLTTDGASFYLHAVKGAFGRWIDYAMLVKIYGQSYESMQGGAHRRYSPAVCVGAEKTVIRGRPDMTLVNTSYVERQNLTMRMHMRRFTRLTNAFSKKVEYHLYAVALHFTYYNFCRPHQTLTKAAGGIKTTPAMKAGLADRPWTVEDILKLLQSD